MMVSLSFLEYLLLSSSLSPPCAENLDVMVDDSVLGAAGLDAPQSEKSIIESVIRASIGWAMNKDKRLLYNSVAQDVDFFIFHPDSESTIIGFQAFRNMVESVFMQDRFKATGYEIRQLRITTSKSGEVAWFSAYLDDHGEWAGKPSSWVNTRWTGVLEKRSGKWLIVQMHFSFAKDEPVQSKIN